MKKIAIFHNFLDNIGGAEMVSLILARELNADVYTTNIDEEKIKKMGFEKILSRIFSIGKIPLNAPFKQQAALLKFRFLNLKNKYDFFIISGDWAVAGSVNNKPNLWYVHSPIREIWDLKDYIKNNVISWWQKPIFEFWVTYNRHLNKKYLKHVSRIVCNSENTKRRLKKYLNKDAVVINPPVETKKFHYQEHKNYWLSVNRLFNHKRIDIQLDAFKSLQNEKLIIIGSYEKSKHFQDYAKKCFNIKPKNVEIKSWVSEKDLVDLYANCKGLIATSRDEDFGMNAIEAMASGKPVIAPAEGGYLETVINGKTGLLVSPMNSESLIDAVKSISNKTVSFKYDCLEQAKKFDIKIFIEKIKSEIKL